MNWEDERYVRLYVRDTVTWKLMGWQARCLLPLLLRKVDRVGVLDLGGSGAEGVAVLVDIPLEIAEAGFNALLARGVIETKDGSLIIPHFLEAQESKQSDKQRQAESRLRRRDMIRSGLDPDAREAVIYFIQSEHGGSIKIGRADDLAKRLVNLQTSRPDKLVVLAAAQGTVEHERLLHTRFAAAREKGEWFAPTAELMSLIGDVVSHGSLALSQFVTGHNASDVTPSRTVLSLAVPSRAEEAKASMLAGGTSPTPPAKTQIALLPDEPKPARKTRERKPRAQTPERLTAHAAVWAAYAEAFRHRYQCEPVRNGKVDGMISQFLARVPLTDAPEIARWYVRHSGAFYAASMHAVGLMLRDAEKLAAEWRRGEQVNAETARRNEQTEANPFAQELLRRQRERAQRGDVIDIAARSEDEDGT